MREEKLTYFKQLEEMKIIQRQKCTSEEIAQYKTLPVEELPAGVYRSGEEFVKFQDLSDTELQTKIAIANAKNIITIKGCVIFFTIITVIGILVSLVSVASLS